MMPVPAGTAKSRTDGRLAGPLALEPGVPRES